MVQFLYDDLLHSQKRFFCREGIAVLEILKKSEKKLDLDAKIRTQFNRNIALPHSKKENVKFEDLKTNKLLNQQCFCRKRTNQNVDVLQKPYLLLCIKSRQGAQIWV
jgi:hypothetical protein